MNDKKNTNDETTLKNQVNISRDDNQLSIIQYEKDLVSFLSSNDLPVSNVFSPVPERVAVFNNVDWTLSSLDVNYKRDSIYISKFIAAVSAGLFDAALNYLWNETINELRYRVSQYDLDFFFDTAINSPDKRKKLKDAEDLVKISDSELIHGSKEIGLISDIGFRHLDYVKYMRNWSSAAHPNQSEITGLQLISWLETCIKEVISLPPSEINVVIKQLLTNLRANALTSDEARQTGLFFHDLTSEQSNNLLSGFFGMYTRTSSSVQLKDNIKLILPYLWTHVEEKDKFAIGIKYGKYIANNDSKEATLSREFLEIVDGNAYIPEKILTSEIDTAIDNLLGAHRNTNNFYSEPMYVKELRRLIGEDDTNSVASSIKEKYINALVEVYLTNGNGISWGAESIYEEMLKSLDSKEALLAVLAIYNPVIENKLSYFLCAEKYKEMVRILKPKITSKPALELINLIENFSGPIEKIKMDTTFKKISDPIVDILRGIKK